MPSTDFLTATTTAVSAFLLAKTSAIARECAYSRAKAPKQNQQAITGLTSRKSVKGSVVTSAAADFAAVRYCHGVQQKSTGSIA